MADVIHLHEARARRADRDEAISAPIRHVADIGVVHTVVVIDGEERWFSETVAQWRKRMLEGEDAADIAEALEREVNGG